METEHIEDSLRALLPKDEPKAVEKPAEAALRTRMWVPPLSGRRPCGSAVVDPLSQRTATNGSLLLRIDLG